MAPPLMTYLTEFADWRPNAEVRAERPAANAYVSSTSLQWATDEVASGSVLAETLLTCANPYAAEGDVPCIVLPRAPAIRTMRAKNVRKVVASAYNGPALDCDD